MNLLSNNPAKFQSLEHYGIEIAQRIEVIVPENEHNHDYLITKRDKMGHLI